MILNTFSDNLVNQAQTVGEVVAAAADLAARKSDVRAAGTSLRMLATPTGELNLAIPSNSPFGDFYLPVSQHAFYQTCGRLGMPPGYFKGIPANLAVPHFNHWFETEEREFLIRTLQSDGGDGGESHVRSMLSGDYVVLDNSTVLDVAQQVLHVSGLQDGVNLVRPYLTTELLCLTLTYNTGGLVDAITDKLALPQRERANFAFGVRIENAEDGTGSLRVSPLLQRMSCTNSIVYHKGGFVQNHRGKKASAAFLQAALAEHMGTAMWVGEQMLEKIVAAYAAQVPSLSAILARMAEKHGLTREITDTVMQGSERDNSLWGMVNGLSYAAHAIEGLPQEKRASLEALAGAALVDGWEGLTSYAGDGGEDA